MSKKWPSDLSFRRGFWHQLRPKIEKKSFRNRSLNAYDFLIDFWSILAPFWPPCATLKSDIFHSFSLLLSLLRHLGAKRLPKVLQDSPKARFSSIFVYFGVIFHRFWQRLLGAAFANECEPQSLLRHASRSMLIEFRNRFRLRCLIFLFNFWCPSQVSASSSGTVAACCAKRPG